MLLYWGFVVYSQTVGRRGHGKQLGSTTHRQLLKARQIARDREVRTNGFTPPTEGSGTVGEVEVVRFGRKRLRDTEPMAVGFAPKPEWVRKNDDETHPLYRLMVAVAKDQGVDKALKTELVGHFSPQRIQGTIEIGIHLRDAHRAAKERG